VRIKVFLDPAFELSGCCRSCDLQPTELEEGCWVEVISHTHTACFSKL